ncbi:MAG: undecaprenyl-diphosphate phosphatase [Oligoflexia bacterium]|nr:undecaprenyl-diphosphate phosphatase [Oligoflexia bacterium]
MDHLQAVLLGIIEGLTEFIPVSSTGHLIILGNLLGIDEQAAPTFEIFIQLGAILAVVALYFKRFKGLLDFSQPSAPSFSGWAGLLRLGAACLPVFLIGALTHHWIKAHLFFPGSVAAALILGGVVMLWVENRSALSITTAKIEQLTLQQALLIGIFQILALWPGVSRSGATIIGAMLLGVGRSAAAEFSFLVAVPVMAAATLFDLLKSWSAIPSEQLVSFGIGFLVAFLTALVALRVFIGLVSRYSMRPFGWYRIGLGVLVLLLTR